MRIRESVQILINLRQLGLAVLFSVCARDTLAQSLPQSVQAPTPIGVWRGTSMCLVRPSPCKDEVVVYRIARVNMADSVSVDARKIVDAEEEEMGVLLCRLVAAAAQVTCASGGDTWQFTALGDTLVGQLRLTDGTVFRRARAVRISGPQESRGTQEAGESGRHDFAIESHVPSSKYITYEAGIAFRPAPFGSCTSSAVEAVTWADAQGTAELSASPAAPDTRLEPGGIQPAPPGPPGKG